MAGEGKGENKLFQIVMVVVTTIIAPLSVYFVTHAVPVPSDPTAAPTSTLSSPVGAASITATPDLPLFTPTIDLSKTVTAQPQSTPTPQGTVLPVIQNPQGILPADEVGVVNGIAVSVVSSEVQVKDKTASFQIHVRNLSSQPQTFVYRVQSITVKDASGRILEVIYGDKPNACAKKDLGAERKINLVSNQEIILQSVDGNNRVNWCGPQSDRTLPLYQVATKDAPATIVIQMNDFGPFKGFGFKIDL